jgi:hypothetical protein
LTFQKYATDKSAGLLRESLFNMEKLAQSAINDSQIFLDIGDLIAEQLEKNQLDLDHQTFSIKTIETILIFLNPILVVCLIVGFRENLLEISYHHSCIVASPTARSKHGDNFAQSLCPK